MIQKVVYQKENLLDLDSDLGKFGFIESFTNRDFGFVY